MIFSPRLAAVFRPRWVRALAITLACAGVLVAISAAGRCLFYLNGSRTVLVVELVLWSWLLLLFVFVARTWGRPFLVMLAVLVPLVVPRCIFMVHPDVLVVVRLEMAARDVHALVGSQQGSFPDAVPNSLFAAASATTGWQFRYVAFRDATATSNNHFRIEALRRHCLCRALGNLTIFDDGRLYSTNDYRPATASDHLIYQPPTETEAR